MVTGKDLIERGWPEGPTIGLAVAAARELSERGMDDDSIVRELDQMAGAMRLPVSVGGALMPDAHLGYGLPVGGVLATEGAVIPWAVGVDIAPLRGDTLVPTLDGRSYPIKELCERGGEFGVWSCKPDGKVVAARARAFHTQKNVPLVKVTLDNGRVVECTPDHLFMMRDGTFTEAEG